MDNANNRIVVFKIFEFPKYFLHINISNLYLIMVLEYFNETFPDNKYYKHVFMRGFTMLNTSPDNLRRSAPYYACA